MSQFKSLRQATNRPRASRGGAATAEGPGQRHAEGARGAAASRRGLSGRSRGEAAGDGVAQLAAHDDVASGAGLAGHAERRLECRREGLRRCGRGQGSSAQCDDVRAPRCPTERGGGSASLSGGKGRTRWPLAWLSKTAVVFKLQYL